MLCNRQVLVTFSSLEKHTEQTSQSVILENVELSLKHLIIMLLIM